MKLYFRPSVYLRVYLVEISVSSLFQLREVLLSSKIFSRARRCCVSNNMDNLQFDSGLEPSHHSETTSWSWYQFDSYDEYWEDEDNIWTLQADEEADEARRKLVDYCSRWPSYPHQHRHNPALTRKYVPSTIVSSDDLEENILFTVLDQESTDLVGSRSLEEFFIDLHRALQFAEEEAEIQELITYEQGCLQEIASGAQRPVSTTTESQPTFTMFLQLPKKIRVMIWKAAAQLPRFIRMERVLESDTRFGADNRPRARVSTPSRRPPAMMSVCVEAREVALRYYRLTMLDLYIPVGSHLGTPIYSNADADILYLDNRLGITIMGNILSNRLPINKIALLTSQKKYGGYSAGHTGRNALHYYDNEDGLAYE